MTFWPLKVMWHKWEVVIVIVSKFGGNGLKHVEIMGNWNVARKKKQKQLVLRAELNIAAECEIVEILWTRRDMLRKRVNLIMCSCRLGCCMVPPCQFFRQSEHFGNLTFDRKSHFLWLPDVLENVFMLFRVFQSTFIFIFKSIGQFCKFDLWPIKFDLWGQRSPWFVQYFFLSLSVLVK